MDNHLPITPMIVPAAAADATRPLVSEDAFCAWLGAAAPGEVLLYHRGFLAVDCGPPVPPFAEAIGKRLSNLARRAAQAAQDGSVCLVQSRHGDGDYSYLAVATLRTRAPRRSLASLGSQPANGGAA